MRVLAVDPGRQKCGLAVCDPGGVIAHAVVALDELAPLAKEWVRSHRVEWVVVGSGTGSREVVARLFGLAAPVRVLGERGTTLQARRRYFKDHPPRGWRRLLPLSLQVPPVPYDDYSAIALAEEFLRRKFPEISRR